MKPFIVRNADGVVVRYGYAPDDMVRLQAGSSETVEEGEYTPEQSPTIELTYAGKRAMAYPSITDQLDALWKGGEEMIAMQQKIMAVKAAYPKGDM